MAYNYHILIRTLVAFKNRLHLVKKEKYREIISLIKTFSITIDESGEEEVPGVTDIVEALQIPKPRGSKLIRDLHSDLMEILWMNPPQVDKYYHTIVIGIPWDELPPAPKRGKDTRFQLSRTMWLKLPVNPRIGEKIDLRMFDDLRYSSGYVYEINHVVHGDVVEIMVWVHPHDNEYGRWLKLKEEHRRKTFWRNQLRETSTH